MELRWYKLALNCPQCKKEARVLFVAGSADGEIRFEMLCPSCDTRFYTITTGASIVAQAAWRDVEERLAKWSPQQNPVRPPLKNKLEKHADSAFLHDLGIDPEEEE